MTVEERPYVKLLRQEVRILELSLKLYHDAPAAPYQQRSWADELVRLTEEFARGVLAISKKPRERLGMTEREIVDRHQLLRICPLGGRHTHDQSRDLFKLAAKKIDGKRKRQRLEKAMDRHGLGHHASWTPACLVPHYLVCRWLDDHAEDASIWEHVHRPARAFQIGQISYYGVLDKAEMEYLGWPPHREREKV